MTTFSWKPVICPQCGQLASDGNHFCPVPMTAGTRPVVDDPVFSAISDLQRRVAQLEAQARPPQMEANARVLAGRVDELNAKLADAIARADAAERERDSLAGVRVEANQRIARLALQVDELTEMERDVRVERDAERERAGRLRGIVEKHRLIVAQSPGVGVDAQGYAIGVCNDILNEIDRLALPASDTKEDE